MSYVARDFVEPSGLTEGVRFEVLQIELAQAFRGEAKFGKEYIDPKHMALTLFAQGFSPGAARWMLREARVTACVELI